MLYLQFLSSTFPLHVWVFPPFFVVLLFLLFWLFSFFLLYCCSDSSILLVFYSLLFFIFLFSSSFSSFSFYTRLSSSFPSSFSCSWQSFVTSFSCSSSSFVLIICGGSTAYGRLQCCVHCDAGYICEARACCAWWACPRLSFRTTAVLACMRLPLLNVLRRQQNAGNSGSSGRMSACRFRMQTVAGVLVEVREIRGAGEGERSSTYTLRVFSS